jgi:hypothetical protein
MPDHDDRTVMITFTRTTEYGAELDFADAAKAMGVSKKKLAAILDDGEDYEPSDTAVKRLTRASDINSEETVIDGIDG